MNEVNNENIGNQMPNGQMNYQTNNQPSNNNKSSNGLMIVIIILLLALIGVVVYAFILKPTDNKKGGSNPNNGTTNNEVQQPQNNETVEKETEVEKNKYSYLIEALNKFGQCPGCSDGISAYLNLDNISNEDKILTAINNIKPEENAKINITDEIDYYNGETEKHTGYKLTNDDIAMAMDNGIYSAEKVEKKLKEIFGKNTNINHEAVGLYVYDKTAKLYYVIRGGGCGCGAGSFQEIDKVTTSGNKLYVYTHAGFTSFDGYICYKNDINEKDLNSSSCVNVVKKYSLNENDDNYDDQIDEKMDLIKTTDKDKFAKYKYTFEKEDNNYIIKKLEKIS